MSTEERYDREHQYNTVRFYLGDFYPDLDQCRYLMLKVMEQAVRDYCALYNSELPNEKLLWETANAFIFDDDYLMDWGEWQLSTKEYLDILDLDISWFREQVTKKFKAIGDTNGNQKARRKEGRK